MNFFNLPAAHWKKLRTTNVIERAFREVRRRTRPMSSFTNLASCDRIIYGVISHLNSSWGKKTLFQIYTKPLTLPHCLFRTFLIFFLQA